MGMSIQLRAALPASPHEVPWEIVAEQGARVRKAFAQPGACRFVRAHRNELSLLEGRAAPGFSRPPADFPKTLAQALAGADLLGLAMRSPRGARWHPDQWDAQVRRKLAELAGAEPEPAKTVGAYLLYDDPDLVPDVTEGKRVAWVMDGATRLCALLATKPFRDYYGFGTRVRDLALDVPPCEGWLCDAEVRDRLERWRDSFDVAVFSAGAPAKVWCRFVAEELGKQALDVGGLAAAWLGRPGERPQLFGPKAVARRLVWPPEELPRVPA